jgi:hypothetical protein
MADDNSLALLDPQNQQNYVKGMGLPPVLPSLSKPKPQPQTSVTPQIGTPPLGALPPVTTLDPSPEQQQVSQLRTKLQADTNKLPATEALWNKASQYHKTHPGFVGRLGQVGAGLLRGVDIAGEALSGGASALVPGSIYNHNMNVAQDKANITAAEGNAKTAAETEKDRAEAYKALNPDLAIKPDQPEWEPTSFENKGQPVILEKKGPNAGTTQTLAGMDVKHDKPEAPKEDKAIHSYVGKDNKTHTVFMRPDNSTYEKVFGEVRPAVSNQRQSDAFYTYVEEDEKGQQSVQMVQGKDLPPDADGVIPIKDPSGFMAGARAMNAVQTSFNALAQHDLSMFNDPTTRSVLATAIDENKAHSAGFLVAGTGGSLTLPSGSGHIIDQFLQNNAVPQKYQREAKDFLVDYYSMKDKLIMLQTAAQGGKMGRQMQSTIQTMFAQLPGLASADSQMASRQLKNLQSFISQMKNGALPDHYGNYTKEPDYQFPKAPWER